MLNVTLLRQLYPKSVFYYYEEQEVNFFKASQILKKENEE